MQNVKREKRGEGERDDGKQRQTVEARLEVMRGKERKRGVFSVSEMRV